MNQTLKFAILGWWNNIPSLQADDEVWEGYIEEIREILAENTKQEVVHVASETLGDILKKNGITFDDDETKPVVNSKSLIPSEPEWQEKSAVGRLKEVIVWMKNNHLNEFTFNKAFSGRTMPCWNATKAYLTKKPGFGDLEIRLKKTETGITVLVHARVKESNVPDSKHKIVQRDFSEDDDTDRQLRLVKRDMENIVDTKMYGVEYMFDDVKSCSDLYSKACSYAAKRINRFEWDSGTLNIMRSSDRKTLSIARH